MNGITFLTNDSLPCKCGRPIPPVAFDFDQAYGQPAEVIRKRWPRLVHYCECGNLTIVYANATHYFAGDW